MIMNTIRRLKTVFNLAALVSAVVLGSAQAQLNQNCVVSVLNRTVPVNADGTWVLPNIPANFGTVRARATCVANGITQFGQSALFTIPANGSMNVPPIALGNVTPIPTSITVSSPTNSLSSAGQTVQLTVTATYATGNPQDVTAGSSGTIYNISNPTIATVSTDGLVTAVTSGTVVIQSVNEGRQGIVSLQVVLSGMSHGGIPDDWAIAHGLDPTDPAMPFEDPDHDGLTNLQEFQNGTDPHKADTDGDGLTDGQEVLMYHTNPTLFSSDGTGISDGVEVATNTLGSTLAAKLAAALSSLEVQPSRFTLSVSTIQGQAAQQLNVLGHLIDGTILNLTSTAEGTTYSSSDLTICNFGAPDGNVFAGNSGTCTITVANNGFSAQVQGTITSFSPTALSFVSIPGFANGVDVNGDYAFVAAGSAGLQVVNVSDRTNPTIVASLPLAGNADDVRLLGSLAYVAGDVAGLQVIDVTNPLVPVQRGTLNTSGTALDVAVRGTTAYIANSSNLFIADVTNPAAMTRISALPLNGLVQGVDVDTTRNLAVVTAGTNGIYVVDISNPGAPVVLGSTTTGDARDVAIQGDYAFVADYQNSTVSVDIANPSAPTVVSNITDPNLGGFLQDITLSGNFALAADVKFVNGVPITDVSTPTNLLARAILNFPQRDDNGMGLAADGTYVYLATEHSSLTKFGTTGDSRLYIGQYLPLVDNKGIPPTASITSPVPGSNVVEGQTLPILVNAADDVAVAAVNFFVNGQLMFTATARPYQYNFTVPQVTGPLTIGATAVDLGGNVGTAQNVSVNVIPDPGTTVVGTIVDVNQNPIPGATVTASGLSTMSQPDGSFSIAGVPTVSGSIFASVTVVVNGVTLRGVSGTVPPVRGGTTNVGKVIVSQAVFETNVGSLIAQCDDCYQQITLPFPFAYFGQTYNSVFVNNNGNLGFTYGDYVYTPSIGYFSAQPRISPFWDDLITCGALPSEGLYVNAQIPGEIVFTWLHQQIYYCSGDDTAQAILFADGRIQFGYNGVSTIALPDSTSSGVIVGITPGGNAPLMQVDYVSTPSFTIPNPTALLEFFVQGTNAFNLDGGFILFTPDASGNYTVQLIPPPGSTGSGTSNTTLAVSPSLARVNGQTASTVTVQGIAYDAQGSVLPGVQINVTSSMALSFKGVTTTDQNGHYSVPGVPYGGISVVAVQSGAAVAVGAAVVQSGTSVTIDARPPTNPPKSRSNAMSNAPLTRGAQTRAGGQHL